MHQFYQRIILLLHIMQVYAPYVCVIDLLQTDGFLRVLRFPPPIKLTTMHDITEILLKVASNTINQTKPFLFVTKISYTCDLPLFFSVLLIINNADFNISFCFKLLINDTNKMRTLYILTQLCFVYICYVFVMLGILMTVFVRSALPVFNDLSDTSTLM